MSPDGRAWTIRLGDRGWHVEIEPDGTVRVDGAGIFEVRELDRTTYVVRMGERRVTVHVADAGGVRWAFAEGRTYRFEVQSGGHAVPAAPGPAPGHDLTAPMPATVAKILVAPGASVSRGEPVIILEAMKMELPLLAPHDGTVRRIDCAEGMLVQPGIVLVEVDPV